VIGLGAALLVAALGLEAYGIAASLYGARRREDRFVVSGRRAVFAVAGVLTICFAILEAAFLRSDFSVDVVAAHSSTTTPAFYRATAMWSAQEGSLLLWVWLLSLWSTLALVVNRGRLRPVMPYAQAVLLTFAGFFTLLLVFKANPFATSDPAPPEGMGLNPLLRNPSMMIHPPLLYSGYTLFTVPFAFAVGALASRRLDAEWIARTRVFALLAWLCLGFGILLGARWSYVELGWGGYWGWDPVENASLMPWLTGTALIHSIHVQERRGLLKVWNVSLVLATGILAILGTFLVRSGVLSSIHAFGASTLGVPFLVFIAVLCAGSLVLVVSRLDGLRAEGQIDSLLSREFAFLLNNLVLIGLCAVIFWGTFFPLISEAVTGTKASVGPPWFDRYITPLALVLVALAGIGPMLAWGRGTWSRLPGLFARPLAAAALAFVVAGVVAGATARPRALALFCIASFAVAALVQEFMLGARARRAVTAERTPAAAIALVRRNRRRYGGYVVHIGMAVLFVGVAASSAFQHTRDIRLRPGQTTRVGDYTIRYVSPVSAMTAEKVTLGSMLDFSRGGHHVATLVPTRAYYPSLDDAQFGRIGRFFNGEATSELGLRAGLRRDLWTAVQPDLSGVEPAIRSADQSFPDANPQVEGLVVAAVVRSWMRSGAPAQFRLIVSPLVAWIWLGGAIAIGGAMLSLWPAPARARRATRTVASPQLTRDPVKT
jgi:cytochrome c-type biogenesis protein CcmF